MTSYTAIVGTAIDQDSPATEELFEALRDNPIALAEGATGAPKIARKTMAGAATAGAPLDITGLDDFSGILIKAGFSNSGGAVRSITIAFSDDGSTLYGTSTVATVGASENGSFEIYVDFATGDVDGYVNLPNSALVNATVVSLSTDVVAVRIACDTDLTVNVLACPDGGQSAS